LDGLLPDGPGGTVPVAAISGSPGIGKTALAVHWAHRVRDRFPDGQLYANLRGHAHGPPAAPVEILARFLSALGIAAERVPTDVETASALYRTLLTDRNLLVVLDNVAGPEQIRPLLPPGPGCLLLTTGRDRMTGLVATHGAHPLTLDVLSPEAALDLVAHVLGPDRVAAEPAAAAEFAKLCAYLPLALRIATANLAEHPGRGIAGHVEELRERNVLTALSVRGDEQTAVRTAFSLSHTSLPAEAQRLFRLLSLVPGTDVSGEAVAALAGTEPDRADRLLDRLAGAHLVESQAPGRYRFHDLLRRYATEQGDRPEHVEDLDRARIRLHDWYLGAADAAARLLYPHMLRLPIPETATRAPDGFGDPAAASNWLDAERGNLVAAVRSGPAPHAWLLADALRGYFWMGMHRVDWLAAAEAGLAAAEAAGEPRAQAAAQLSFADLQFRQGRYRLAVRHYAHARILAARTGWAEAQAAVLGNLGCVYWQSGRLSRAASRFGRGLAISRRIGQPAGEAVALGNLGLVHWEMGALTRAAEHYAQALSRYRRLGSRYGEAINLANLAQTQCARGRLAEAAELLTRALALHREDGNRSGEAETHSRLAATHCELGHRAEALESARTGLALAQESGDPHTEAEALATLAAVLNRIGQARDAARRYRQALELIRESGDRYPEVDALIGLATATGDPDPAHHALALAERAGYRALRGRAMTALAEVLLAQGKARHAADHARAALAIHRQTGHRLGEAHTVTLLERAGVRT
jgi:tetratricopeptide (TPR) repeat protein